MIRWPGSYDRGMIRNVVPRVTVIGAATSAGSHHAGQERAPAALRAAGFIARLQEAGLDVTDVGDIARATFAPDEIGSTARSLATVVRVAGTVADAVEKALATGRLPVVLGGDCTVTLGVMAGVQRHGPDAGLLYVDGDADLDTPDTTSSGVGVPLSVVAGCCPSSTAFRACGPPSAPR